MIDNRRTVNGFADNIEIKYKFNIFTLTSSFEINVE
jgi:hypothetical protein